MNIWGTVPEWVTVAAGIVSVIYLIDYASSARNQVEATSRPIIACEEPDHDDVVVFKNVGNGAALNVKWEFSGEERGCYETTRSDLARAGATSELPTNHPRQEKRLVRVMRAMAM